VLPYLVVPGHLALTNPVCDPADAQVHAVQVGYFDAFVLGEVAVADLAHARRFNGGTNPTARPSQVDR
jgi:hypothetical protein